MKSEVPFESIYRLMHPRLTVLVTSIYKGKANIITLAWSMPVSMNPPMAAISVAPERYSHGLIEKTKEFVINIPTEEIVKEVLFCGRHSGRDCDKFEKTGLTQVPAKKVKPPLIEECISHIECIVENTVTAGDHTIFIGKVVAASVADSLFDKKYDEKKVKLLYHLGGDDFVTTGTEKILY